MTLSTVNSKNARGEAKTSLETSTIIVTYNGRHYLERCLAALTSEIEDGEIIVVDNDSSDGTRQFISDNFPEVCLIKNRDNIGFAAACNMGARLAKGRYLLFLNQDTEVHPGWLQGLVGELETDSTVGLTTSQMLLMRDPHLIHLCGQDVHYTGLVFGKGYGERSERYLLPADVNAVSGGSFAIRRDLWQELGGFDETFYMYYEETDLSLRAQLAGYRCRYVPASQLLHDYMPGPPGVNQQFYNFRNRPIMLLKNWRLKTLLLLSPALLLAELIELGLAITRGRQGVRAKLAAYRWIFSHSAAVRQSMARANPPADRSSAEARLLASLANEVQPTLASERSLPQPLLRAANAIFRLNWRGALALMGDPGQS